MPPACLQAHDRGFSRTCVTLGGRLVCGELPTLLGPSAVQLRPSQLASAPSILLVVLFLGASETEGERNRVDNAHPDTYASTRTFSSAPLQLYNDVCNTSVHLTSFKSVLQSLSKFIQVKHMYICEILCIHHIRFRQFTRLCK